MRKEGSEEKRSKGGEHGKGLVLNTYMYAALTPMPASMMQHQIGDS